MGSEMCIRDRWRRVRQDKNNSSDGGDNAGSSGSTKRNASGSGSSGSHADGQDKPQGEGGEFLEQLLETKKANLLLRQDVLELQRQVFHYLLSCSIFTMMMMMIRMT